MHAVVPPVARAGPRAADDRQDVRDGLRDHAAAHRAVPDEARDLPGNGLLPHLLAAAVHPVLRLLDFRAVLAAPGVRLPERVGLAGLLHLLHKLGGRLHADGEHAHDERADQHPAYRVTNNKLKLKQQRHSNTGSWGGKVFAAECKPANVIETTKLFNAISGYT